MCERLIIYSGKAQTLCLHTMLPQFKISLCELSQFLDLDFYPLPIRVPFRRGAGPESESRGKGKTGKIKTGRVAK